MTQRIKRHLAFVSMLPVLLSSCATVLNSPVQRVVIATDTNIKVLLVEKAMLVDATAMGPRTSGAYDLPRSKDPARVQLQVDSVRRSILLKPTSSFAYWFNIYATYGLGLLIDRDNAKRYAYPARSYITVKDTTLRRSRFAPVKKGTLNLSLVLPLATIFDINTPEGNYGSAGIYGIEAGMDYCYRDNRYLSFHAGIATDLFGEYFGPGYREAGHTLFVSMRNTHVVGSFDLGYGLHLSQLRWTRRTVGDTVKMDRSVSNIGIGPSLQAQYRIGNYVRASLLYQPALLNASHKPALSYQHYITVGLTWKLPL